MKKDLSHLDKFRHPDPDIGGESGMADGTYRIPHQDTILQVIASELHDFDRVSVTAHDERPQRRSGWATREPSLKELRWVRRLFFEDDEMVVVPVLTEGNSQSKAVQMFRAQDVPMPQFGS